MAKRRRRAKKLDRIDSENWDEILDDVQKKEIPIELIDFVLVKFINDERVKINIAELLEEGASPEEIEARLNEKLKALDDIIQDVDFHITKEKIVKIVAACTRRLLKKIP